MRPVRSELGGTSVYWRRNEGGRIGRMRQKGEPSRTHTTQWRKHEREVAWKPAFSSCPVPPFTFKGRGLPRTAANVAADGAALSHSLRPLAPSSDGPGLPRRHSVVAHLPLWPVCMYYARMCILRKGQRFFLLRVGKNRRARRRPSWNAASFFLSGRFVSPRTAAGLAESRVVSIFWCFAHRVMSHSSQGVPSADSASTGRQSEAAAVY